MGDNNMHTWSKEDSHSPTFSFIFDQDFSGNIVIRDHVNDEEVTINIDILLEFIAENYIRPEKIRDIENTDWKNLY
jgi:predicted butyrate kinase (DUF1464 family)